MRYLQLDRLPGAARAPGAFLDTEIKDGILSAACCFLSYELSNLVNTYYPATDETGQKYEVLIPESEGLREGVTVVKGLLEAGIQTEVRRA